MLIGRKEELKTLHQALIAMNRSLLPYMGADEWERLSW